MNFIETSFKNLYLVKFNPFEDERGVFIKPYISDDFQDCFGLVAETYFSSSKACTFRGLHYQKGLAAQKKYIICLQGSVEDIALDLRLDSDTYGKVFRYRLSAGDGVGIIVPEGFAHGFYAYQESIIVNFCNKPYSPKEEAGYHFQSLGDLIDLDVKLISSKDAQLDFFSRSSR